MDGCVCPSAEKRAARSWSKFEWKGTTTETSDKGGLPVRYPSWQVCVTGVGVAISGATWFASRIGKLAGVAPRARLGFLNRLTSCYRGREVSQSDWEWGYAIL